jgi:hypothetical protein
LVLDGKKKVKTMKRAGTLKLEIIKPRDEPWQRVSRRLHALRSALPLALNFALRDVFPAAMAQLESALEKTPADQKWQNDVRKRLAFHWSRQLERRRDYDLKKYPDADATVYAPVGDVLCSETSDHIVSRFKGEHFKALLGGRAGVPTFEGGGKAFFSEGRKCELTGTVDEARISFPLWGSGKSATWFVVAACGGSARVLLGRLLGDAGLRTDVVALERAAKAKLPKDGPPKALADAKAERERAAHALEEMGAIKLGKVGIKFDERKRKWFVLASWSESAPDRYAAGQAAACNFGARVAIQAMAEDGTTWERSGADVLAMRDRFRARRCALAKAKRCHGSGSRGHGKKRRELPMTRIANAEQRWIQNWIRTTAADFSGWCRTHRVSDVYLEDLSGVRESFERATGGDAPEQMKRLLHEWPYYQTQQAVERRLSEFSIRVHYKSTRGVSTRCPARKADGTPCGCDSPDNVTSVEVAGQVKAIKNSAGELELFKRVERRSRFRCVECGLFAMGDVIACANHLLDVGKTHALEKMQDKARERSKIARGSVGKVAETVAAE